MEHDRVADGLDIRNLIARLAAAADGGTVEEYMSVFADGAVMEMPGCASREGLDGLRAGMLAGRQGGGTGPGSHTMHFLGASAVAIEGDAGHQQHAVGALAHR